MLVVALMDLEVNYQLQKKTAKKTKEKIKRKKALSIQLKSKLDQSNCPTMLQNEATCGADTLKIPYLVLHLNHFYKTIVPPKRKVIELKELFTKAYN